jgi:uncharacterized protein YjbI with pentapeptide repeats
LYACKNLCSGDKEERNLMANQFHLDLLHQGTLIWNQWRQEHPDIVPDLSRANLFETNLSGADLHGANLQWADLSKTTLWGTNFRGANLSGVDFYRASLRDADLHGANLSGADLRWANLQGADLHEADLSGADLRWVELNEDALLQLTDQDL